MKALLQPVVYKIEQEQSPHTYWIQKMCAYTDPKWCVLCRLNDIRAILESSRAGYDSAEEALAAWQEYADFIWPGTAEDESDSVPKEHLAGNDNDWSAFYGSKFTDAE